MPASSSINGPWYERLRWLVEGSRFLGTTIDVFVAQMAMASHRGHASGSAKQIFAGAKLCTALIQSRHAKTVTKVRRSIYK